MDNRNTHIVEFLNRYDEQKIVRKNINDLTANIRRLIYCLRCNPDTPEKMKMEREIKKYELALNFCVAREKVIDTGCFKIEKGREVIKW